MSSPVAQQKVLQKAIREQAFAPVYYFHGEDDYLKDAAVRQLADAAVDPATRDFNHEARRAADLDAETLGSLLGTPPMMAERRMLVVRDLGGMKKDARAALDHYLGRPAPDLLLVLVAAAGTKAEKALCTAAVPVEFAPLDDERLPKWIAHHAQSHLDATISPAAAALLQGAIGNDLPALACELEKLCAYTSGAPIDEEAVAAVVGVRRGETLSDLLDAIAGREVNTALGLVRHVLAQPKSGAVPIIMAISTQVLAMAWGRARLDGGATRKLLASDYFTLMKETGAYPMRSWGEAASAWTRYIDRWTLPELDRALGVLLLADASAKETTLSTEAQLVTSVVLELCAGGTRAERAAPRAA